MRKPDFCLCENKGADQLGSISTFVFATCIVQFLYFLNPKFLAFSLFLLLYRPVVSGLVGNLEDRFFLRCGSCVLNNGKQFSREDTCCTVMITIQFGC